MNIKDEFSDALKFNPLDKKIKKSKASKKSIKANYEKNLEIKKLVKNYYTSEKPSQKQCEMRLYQLQERRDRQKNVKVPTYISTFFGVIFFIFAIVYSDFDKVDLHQKSNFFVILSMLILSVLLIILIYLLLSVLHERVFQRELIINIEIEYLQNYLKNIKKFET